MHAVYNHQCRQVSPIVQNRINALKIGQKMQDLPEELWHDSFRYYLKEDPNRAGGPNMRLIRLDPNAPSLTVTGYIFNKFVHPYENRFITPREAARLQGFPDELKFYGTLTNVQSQIGDAIPIELGKAVFNSLLNTLHKKWPNRPHFNALSLFSGAGKFDIAASQLQHPENVEIRTLACIELEEDRCNTLCHYFANTLQILQEDIRAISPTMLTHRCEFSIGDIDIVYGGPPCQPFSQAGKQKGQNDPRGNLVDEFIRVVRELQPPFFVMENVANLKGIDQGKLLAQIIKEMNRAGYSVKYGILTATHYGSPQKRRRMIFMGSRIDLDIESLMLPEPTHGEHSSLLGLQPFKTVGEAFAGLPSLNYCPRIF